MDIVIPLGRGSVNSNMELRYCLRGIQLYVHDVENVFIVGERPAFVRNVIHIPAADMDGHQWKERNIFSKIMLACSDKRVSDDFIFFNDDHFLLRPWQDHYYHRGSLEETLNKRMVKDSYYTALCNTIGLIGSDAKNFDAHCPIVYNKERFKRTVGVQHWYTKGGYLIKSLYGKLNGITGSYIPDLKITRPFDLFDLKIMTRNRPCFSVGDHGINDAMKKLLTELYPSKSIYEND